MRRSDARWLFERPRSARLIVRIQMPNMHSLPNKSIRRNTAWGMLLVWVFALASGLVNACLLEPHGIRDHGPPPSHRAPEDGAPGLVAHHAIDAADAADGDGDGDSDSMLAKESCLKACNEGSQTLLKQATGFDLVDPGLAPSVAAAWAAPVHTVPAFGRALDFRLPERGPPIRVLFSRLAL